MRFVHAISPAFISAALLATLPAKAEQLISDTLVVSGALCAGASCMTGETFTDGAIKFRQNAVRIHLDDASAVDQTDWQIAINDGAQTGPSFFAINDLSAGTTPFNIDAGAPSGAFTVAASGFIGLGTTLPMAELHLLSADFDPSLRLERSSANPFGSATWDLQIGAAGGLVLKNNGNNTIYFDSGLEDFAFIMSNDGAGIGGITPKAKLHIDIDTDDTTFPYGLLLTDNNNQNPAAMAHVSSLTGDAQLLIENFSDTVGPATLLYLKNRGRPEIALANTSTGGEWSFGAGNNFVLKTGAVGSTDAEKTLHLKLFGATGNLEITGQLISGGGACGGGCDRVFSPEYDLPSIAEHAARMKSLGYLPNVGPTPEGAPINVSDKLGRMLNELEHAHLFIAQQNEQLTAQAARLAQQNNRLAGQQRQLATLTARIAALEAAGQP